MQEGKVRARNQDKTRLGPVNTGHQLPDLWSTREGYVEDMETFLSQQETIHDRSRGVQIRSIPSDTNDYATPAMNTRI